MVRPRIRFFVAENGNRENAPSRAASAFARAMSAAARTAIEATDVKDPEALFAASGDIYQSCTDCHEKYIFTAQPDGQQ